MSGHSDPSIMQLIEQSAIATQKFHALVVSLTMELRAAFAGRGLLLPSAVDAAFLSFQEVMACDPASKEAAEFLRGARAMFPEAWRAQNSAAFSAAMSMVSNVSSMFFATALLGDEQCETNGQEVPPWRLACGALSRRCSGSDFAIARDFHAVAMALAVW